MTAENTLDRPAWVPAFEGQRPPFREGNVASLISGYKSPRTIEALALVVRAEILAADPNLDRDRYRYSVDSAAWSVAETRLLREHVATVGMFDAKGNPRSALLDRLHASERRTERALAAIGFDPTSEARLRRDQAATVAYSAPEILGVLAAQGQAIRDARAAASHELAALDPEAVTELDRQREDTP